MKRWRGSSLSLVALVVLSACGPETQTTTIADTALTSTASPGATSTTTSQAATSTVPATGDGWRVVDVAADDVLNVRTGPGVRYDVIGNLTPDATGVEISGDGARIGSSLWVEVLPASSRGWVNARFLEPPVPEEAATIEDRLDEAAQYASPAVWDVTGVSPTDVLNAREGPGVSYDIVFRFADDAAGVASSGDLARIGDSVWVEVEAEDGESVWVNAAFLVAGSGGVTASRPCDPFERYDSSGIIGQHGGGGTATTITDLDWGEHGNGTAACERLVISLGSGSLGPVRITHEGDRVVVDLGGGVVTAALPTATQLEVGRLIAGAWVVRPLPSSPQAGLYVAIHLNEDAMARATLLQRPGQVIIDVIRGPSPPGAVRRILSNGFVVVPDLDPGYGTFTYPFEVLGYGRGFEATVVVQVSDQAGSPVSLQVRDAGGTVTASEFATTASDWLEVWGEFRFTVLSGPSGALTNMFLAGGVGEGPLVGVTTSFVAN